MTFYYNVKIWRVEGPNQTISKNPNEVAMVHCVIKYNTEDNMVHAYHFFKYRMFYLTKTFPPAFSIFSWAAFEIVNFLNVNEFVISPLAKILTFGTLPFSSLTIFKSTSFCGVRTVPDSIAAKADTFKATGFISKDLFIFLENYEGTHKELFFEVIVNSLKNLLEKLIKLEELITKTI